MRHRSVLTTLTITFHDFLLGEHQGFVVIIMTLALHSEFWRSEPGPAAFS